jgi:hypothetical protein
LPFVIILPIWTNLVLSPTHLHGYEKAKAN